MATRMQQRRGTYQQWFDYNPILSAAEIGWESDTNKFKIGDGVNHWNDLEYFVDAATALASVNNLVDGAPALLDTLNELAAAINDDPNFFTTVATNLSNHESDTTNVHGITNTADLATKTYADTAVSTHSSDTTSVHGITDTAELATKTFAAELLTNATKSNITITGNKNGLTITAENGVADSTTSDLAEGTNLYFTDERAQDAVGNALGTGLSYNDSTGAISVTSNTYDAYGAASTAATNAANALSNHESDTTNVHGISDTANLVTLSGFETLTNKTITSPLGIVKADVGLGNVDNTSDSNKPVSTATQSALNLKADLSGATFTGSLETSGTLNVTDITESNSVVSGSIVTAGGIGIGGNAYVGGDLVLSGDFTVNGTTTTVSTQDLIVQDPLIYVGEDNNANVLDLGIVASFDDGTYQHTGLVRDASAGTWKLFKGVTDEPTSTINFSQGSLDSLAVGGLSATSLTVGDVSNTEFGYLNGVTSAIQTQIDGKISASSSDTLTNKTLDLTSNGISGTIAQFNASLSNADFATLAGTETLTNKTLTSPVISTISNTGTITLPTSTDTLVGKNTTDTLTNKTVSYANNTITVQVANVSDLTATATEINVLDGITATTAELNILDGVTATTAEINVLDGITSTTSELNILHGVTATSAELNVLDGITTSTSELNLLGGLTASALELNVLDGITASTTELNYVDGVTSAIQTQLNAKAPLASPALTGVPTAPTAASGTNTTQVATTAFVDAAIEALASRNLVLDGGGV